MATSRRCFPGGLMPRRTFLADMGMGFTGLALGAMLHRDGFASDTSAWTPPDGRPHFAPKAKSVIWLFMIGGVSHLESFDPKPALNNYAGMSIAETPLAKAPIWPGRCPTRTSPRPFPIRRLISAKIYPLQVGYSKRGESGIEVSDWWPHVGDCVDDIAVIRSMWTNDNDHGAQLRFHTGRKRSTAFFPRSARGFTTAWARSTKTCRSSSSWATPWPIAAADRKSIAPITWAPSTTACRWSPTRPIRWPSAGHAMASSAGARGRVRIARSLDRLVAAEYPDDAKARARIKSYELAFRMQRAIPEVFEFQQETATTQQLYGLDNETTAPFAKNCLAARRLVERGVRFVQIFHGGNGNAGGWDAHSDLLKNHAASAAQTDQPIAALIKDLKQRGMLDETLVVWATEFGRSPRHQGTNGRDHHPFGFSVWMAGGGIKGGVVHGATDELGFSAVENRHYVTDIHATVLHQLGLDSHRLEIPGRKRLELEHGHVIRDILA